MKNLTLIFSLFIILCVCSCSKNTNAPASTTITVSVTDGAAGTAAGAATVNLYESISAVTANTPRYTQTTDQSGQTKFTVAYLSQYYVIVQKGMAKNYYNGLIPVGFFKTQADINNSPIQTPPATIGSVKFQDINGDGVIKHLQTMLNRLQLRLLQIAAMHLIVLFIEFWGFPSPHVAASMLQQISFVSVYANITTRSRLD